MGVELMDEDGGFGWKGAERLDHAVDERALRHRGAHVQLVEVAAPRRHAELIDDRLRIDGLLRTETGMCQLDGSVVGIDRNQHPAADASSRIRQRDVFA